MLKKTLFWILSAIVLWNGGLCWGANASDPFQLASRQGILKIVVDKQGVVLANWRDDIVVVDRENPRLSKQLSLFWNCYDVDPFSYDSTGDAIVETQFLSSPNVSGPSLREIFHVPYKDLKTDPLAKQSDSPDNVPSRYAFVSPYYIFDMIPYEGKYPPMPYHDLSTFPGGVAIAFQFKGQFYLREVASDEKDPRKWINRYAVTAKELPPFVCFRIGDQYQIMTVQGLRYLVTDKELRPVDESGRTASSASTSQSAVTQPEPIDEIAMVIDRTGAKPVAYRLIWRDGALHPLPDDTDTAHVQVAAAATSGINILATSPSVAAMEKLALQRREIERQLQRTEQGTNTDQTAPK